MSCPAGPLPDSALLRALRMVVRGVIGAPVPTAPLGHRTAALPTSLAIALAVLRRDGHVAVAPVASGWCAAVLTPRGYALLAEWINRPGVAG